MAYTTKTALKAYLAIANSNDDDLLTALIDRAQAAIDAYCARTFEASSNTSRTFDSQRDVDGPVLYLDRDLCEINSITNGDGDVLTTSEYTTEPRNDTPYYAIRLLTSANLIWQVSSTTNDHEDAITVSGKWSYSETAPADIVHACLRLAAYYYRQRDSQVFDTTAVPELGILTVPQGIPRDVERILTPYKRLI